MKSNKRVSKELKIHKYFDSRGRVDQTKTREISFEKLWKRKQKKILKLTMSDEHSRPSQVLLRGLLF